MRKQHERQIKKHRTHDSDEDASSSDDVQPAATNTLQKAEAGDNTLSSGGSSPTRPESLSDDEMEVAYEQSFDGKIVRLGKTFVLHGCPWIKGGEWDEVEKTWSEPDDPDSRDPTSLLRAFLKQEDIQFQAWRNEGFVSAVCPIAYS